ncbi:MAG: hypothetical protein LH610_00675 [Sphingomonas bacterium]|nr:hypothetical protein [Sphingomonas bacterium]
MAGLSAIADRHSTEQPVTTPRNDRHMVVTEYGADDLRGRSMRQRAEAPIFTAHPSFRIAHAAEPSDRDRLSLNGRQLA